ncbi:quinoprotein glucose dehydrogenase [Chryseolinea serpens]|uniref:Quinoprotein glucose dehydrogenase n=1 Tax=Chryseolinea serpens TaxID=947013 RepID=A0A1M5LLC8_9BACT|nr:pyrroloquinoline quinone-dependent dehydrogenase [Chryseolinea serpens]SHG65848.1 quinoprotein glucose dehydrogenase [Chryseolinea serpens]
MKRHHPPGPPRLLTLFTTRWLAMAAIATLGACSREEQHTTWSVYKADAGSSSYSALTQINRDNVKDLKSAWTFMPNDAPEGAHFGKAECNPIIVNDVLYATSVRHWVYALEAGTGKKLWSFDPFDGARGGGMYRGVTYWEDGDDKRILLTAGKFLLALDAVTGKPIPSFGENGKVSLNLMPDDQPEGWVVPTSPGIVFGDLLILGSEVSELYGAAPGYVRAFNIRTGALVWTFHTIPHPGEEGYETWPPDAWKYVGGANNWGGMSLDEKRGIVFLPLGSPTYDYYGADRKGQNLFGNCIVALDAKTGKRLWHFQTVHHDLWDYDLPAPPNLVTIEKDGKSIDAIAQTSKTGFVYVLNRETGEPIFPIEERNVPVSTIPGEETWPTQPFPTKPAPYARQVLTEADLTDRSPQARDSALALFRSLRYEGMFTPPDLRGTFMFPGSRGGSEWGGAAYDPSTGWLYVNSNESPEIAQIKKIKKSESSPSGSFFGLGKTLYMNYCSTCHGADRKGREPNFPSLRNISERLSQEAVLNKIKTGGGRMPAFASVVKGHEEEIIAFLFEIKKNEFPKQSALPQDTTSVYLNLTAYSDFEGPDGYPAIKPPWGTLNAINLNTGEYAWKITLGNFPEAQTSDGSLTGTDSWGGPMVTGGGLVFIAGTRDKKFRAFDKATGAVLWETTLPGNGFATPSTYTSGGKQFVVISVTGEKDEPGGRIMAFALPD